MAALAIRDDIDPGELRRRARREHDGRVSARLIGLANALEGMDRATAARLAGMDRQTLRDWVHRYNAEGLAGLFNRPLPGRTPKLTEGQMASLKAIVLRGPDRAVDRVERWRVVDLCRVVEERWGVGYVPGESTSNLFGGNSNWRGPIWMPVNFLPIESLRRFHRYYGDDFTVECPVGSGTQLNLAQVADELSRRLSRLFLKDATGRRPVFGDSQRHQNDPAFRDHVLFHEYFHGDTGRGIGASHQTGWTGLVALLLRDGAQHVAGAADRQDAAPVEAGKRMPLAAD
jgi:transposase